MSEIDDPIVSTTFEVAGVNTETEVRAALQELYDVFADLDIGQATFEVTEADSTQLIVKHKKSVTPDRAAISAALAAAGDFRLIG